MNLDFLYSGKSTEEILKEFSTSINGLSDKEADLRFAKFGPNEIRPKKLSAFAVLLRQFKSPFIYLLFGAAVISLFLKEFADTIMIFSFVLINGILGFYQEFKSEKLVEKLKLLVRSKARAYRNGKIEIINKSKIVKGDIVFMEKGDVIPADIRLIKSQNLIIDESMLTGESISVEKNSNIQSGITEIFKAKNLVFHGCHAISGFGEGVVIATGKETQIGKISELTGHIERKSGFESMVSNFSKFVLNLVLATLAILFLANLILKGFDINIGQTLLFTLALAISVVPEALPVITTITLSKGAFKLSKEHIIVKRLSAIEDLGNIEVLCSDKTGTLTKNEMELKDCVSLNEKKCFAFGAASATMYDQKTLKEDEFDFAIWSKINEDIKKEVKDYKIIWHEPFDPEKRLSSIVVLDKKDNEYYLIIKGAPEETFFKSQFILNDDRAEPFNQDKNIFDNKFREFGKTGFRSLAVAFKKVSAKQDYKKELSVNDFVFLGIFSFHDPLKSTAKEAIASANKLNIEVKIITGDSLEVAEYIAKESGILKDGEKGILGSEFTTMRRDEFSKAVFKYKVFARISPQQKYEIIHEIQKKKPVGFLGEGINDAPALKLANVAIVVDSGADVAKEAADVILLRKDLKVITDGISEGRKIYMNVIKYIKYTLTGNFGNFYAIAGISLITSYLPMLPSQILLTNLLSDLPLMAVAGDNIDTQELRKPSQYNIREIALVSVILGLVSSLADFAFFGLFFKYGEQNVQTMWFIESIFAEIILIFSIRTRLPIWKASLPNRILVIFCVLAIIITVVLPFTSFGQNVFHFARPTFQFLAMVGALVLVYFVLTEVAKIWYYKSFSSNNKS